MNILVGCEFSGIVRDAFRAKGHAAVSCDFEPTEQPGPHIIGDVLKVINQQAWDMLIVFPPCRYLAVSGARWWKDRQQEQAQALNFVRNLLDADISKIALENPVGAISTNIRKADQYIQPWQYGHGEVKKTGFWLKNLPLLKPTKIVSGRHPRIHLEPPSPNRTKNRSRTYPGIAEAMAEQWG